MLSAQLQRQYLKLIEILFNFKFVKNHVTYVPASPCRSPAPSALHIVVRVANSVARDGEDVGRLGQLHDLVHHLDEGVAGLYQIFAPFVQCLKISVKLREFHAYGILGHLPKLQAAEDFRKQGWAKKWAPAWANFVPTVAHHFCRNLPEQFSQPGAYF